MTSKLVEIEIQLVRQHSPGDSRLASGTAAIDPARVASAMAGRDFRASMKGHVIDSGVDLYTTSAHGWSFALQRGSAADITND